MVSLPPNRPHRSCSSTTGAASPCKKQVSRSTPENMAAKKKNVETISITRGSFDFAYFPQDAGKWVSVHTRIVEFHHAEIHNVQRAVLPPFHLDGTFQSSGILADAGKPFLL